MVRAWVAPPRREISSAGKVSAFMALARVDRPEGALLLYWPGAWSIALAAAPATGPDVGLLCLFGVGAFVRLFFE